VKVAAKSEYTIGEAALASGLPVKTVRYYDDAGLIRAQRRGNGYRIYIQRDVELLAFVQRARSLGFSLDECRDLLSLYQDGHRASADVKRLATQRSAEIEQRITELKRLKGALDSLIDACSGDQLPECPILDSLGNRGNRANDQISL
jgi:MerR family transcriptional regulator, copper efflux regulator